MNRFISKRTAAVLIAGLAWATVALPGRGYGQSGDPDPAVHFLWAFGAMVGDAGHRQLVAVDRDLPLHTGDRLKFMLAHQTPCFIYLFHLSGRNELALLYPRQFDARPPPTGAATFVPPDNRWFALDEETGTEKFYLLASSRRLGTIETHYDRYRTLETAVDRQAAMAEIIATIKDLRRRHLRNTGPVERPIRLGGRFRGLEPDERSSFSDLSTIAVEITAPSFYSRTFTIDHR